MLRRYAVTPLRRDPLGCSGRDEFRGGQDSQLSQKQGILAQPTAEGAGTHPSSLRQLILVVAFHLAFTI